MKTEKIKKIVIAICMFLFPGIIIQAYALAADVDIYGEGAINETELKVYLYADVNIDNLLSYGICLNYDPTELSVIQVEKDPNPIPYTDNGTKWYLGETDSVDKNNPLPDFSSPGEIVIIGGKQDPENPGQGISQSSRVLLAVVTFGPINTQIPENPSFFFSYAKGDGSDVYKNFVRLDNNLPQILDGANVAFGLINCVKSKLLE